MTRVAVLTHVKETTYVEPPASARDGPRIAWSGGKIVSNKDEALRKFLQRKARQGGEAALSETQREALRATCE
ncbi:hypothetical protein PINS_up021549 [Pythium insidiosum]|nr:hypothetical protein PINS_up009783 [Pythium insidiosum]GLE09719.1 hypothetical protein PINS_up021549 [Pythium insidiosum]